MYPLPSLPNQTLYSDLYVTLITREGRDTIPVGFNENVGKCPEFATIVGNLLKYYYHIARNQAFACKLVSL